MKNQSGENKVTNKIKVKRMPKRGFYDLETIYKILDDTFVCHIGFTSEGQTFVIPIAFGRKDNAIYFHGAKGSRMLKVLRSGADICVTVSIIDGIVLARSAFHHSMNYRSVVLFGKAEEITEDDKKTEALRNIMDHIIRGRSDEVREPNRKELNATSVFQLKINEASAKIRTGPPIDEEEDMGMNVWAGVIPIKNIAAEPIKDDQLNKDIILPGYIKDYMKLKQL